MNLKKLLKDNGKILAIATTAIGAIGWLANDKMNKIKKQDEISEIVKSAEFKNVVVEIIKNTLDQDGGVNNKLLNIVNSLNNGKDTMSQIKEDAKQDYRDQSEKISKNRDAGVERYITNIERIHESDLRSCERDLQIYRDLLKIKSR